MDDEHEGAAWSTQQSADLYQIRGWGHPYFTINDAGHVQVVPDPERPQFTIDLYELVNDLEARGLDMPLLLRFSDVLKDRIKRINE
jgi:arginine decarboxylase